ncbi:MAG: hydrogenase expression/formation protein HypE [Planctomycetes bacterium]|nr:hydrogenase expression/formation protein HypE [Planctomycetota bacterium]
MRDDVILLADGGGGERMLDLVRREILARFAPADPSGELARLADAARVEAAGPLAFTTDSYVVRPVEFPGGDIGRLAIAGTVNDLACLGARPVAISLALILEEGLALGLLGRVLDSAASTAREVGVPVVCGDTKVVERGSADKLFINTAGIGEIMRGPDGRPRRLAADAIRPGDRVLVSGTVADHGVAVMSKREGLSFEAAVTSDVAPLWPLAARLLEACPRLRVLKDPTRGGLAAAVNELAEAAGVRMRIDEARLPVRPAVMGACDALGLDVLTVANEGKFVVVVAAAEAEAALAAMRSHPLGRDAADIGEVLPEDAADDRARLGPRVTLRTTIGGERILEMPYGEDLPRIC